MAQRSLFGRWVHDRSDRRLSWSPAGSTRAYPIRMPRIVSEASDRSYEAVERGSTVSYST
jgi:hypothetical protein